MNFLLNFSTKTLPCIWFQVGLQFSIGLHVYGGVIVFSMSYKSFFFFFSLCLLCHVWVFHLFSFSFMSYLCFLHQYFFGLLVIFVSYVSLCHYKHSIQIFQVSSLSLCHCKQFFCWSYGFFLCLLVTTSL